MLISLAMRLINTKTKRNDEEDDDNILRKLPNIVMLPYIDSVSFSLHCQISDLPLWLSGAQARFQ